MIKCGLMTDENKLVQNQLSYIFSSYAKYESHLSNIKEDRELPKFEYLTGSRIR